MDRWITFANNLDFYGIYKLINVEVAIIAIRQLALLG
jgi:hypothetical protein